MQNSGHGEPGRAGQGTGIQARGHREPLGVGLGTPRHPAAQDGVSGRFRWAEQGEARKCEVRKAKELRRGDKGRSGFRANAVRVRRSAEGPWLAGQCLPARGSRSSPAPLKHGLRAAAKPESSANGRDGDGLWPFPEGEGGREQGREARQSLRAPVPAFPGVRAALGAGGGDLNEPRAKREPGSSRFVPSLSGNTRRARCPRAGPGWPSPLPGRRRVKALGSSCPGLVHIPPNVPSDLPPPLPSGIPARCRSSPRGLGAAAPP